MGLDVCPRGFIVGYDAVASVNRDKHSMHFIILLFHWIEAVLEKDDYFCPA